MSVHTKRVCIFHSFFPLENDYSNPSCCFFPVVSFLHHKFRMPKFGDVMHIKAVIFFYFNPYLDSCKNVGRNQKYNFEMVTEKRHMAFMLLKKTLG